MGPLLSDKEFFTKLIDLNMDGMEKVRGAVEKEDFTNTRHYFSEFIRKTLKPELFFSIPYEVEQNDFKLGNESVLEAADRICGHKLISCGIMYEFGEKVDWHKNPTIDQYREWTWQLNRHHEFKVLAKAYKDSGEEKYAKCFSELFDSWVKQALAPTVETPYQTLAWRTIDTGIRMGANWHYALYAFYKSKYFTDDILIDWYKSVWEHGKRLRNWPTFGNWLIMEMNGLAHIGMLYTVFKDANEWKTYAFSRLDGELDKQIYPDAFQYELSTNYHEVVINNYFRTINTAKAMDVEFPHTLIKKLENACAVYVKLMMPDGVLPNLNDGSWGKAKEFLSNRIEAFPHREDFKWVVSDGAFGSPPDFTSVSLPYSGFAVMRSSWGKDAVWGIFDSAPFGRAHQHEDKLSFMLYANKKLLIGEGGIYAYDESEMRKYILSTRSHNTIRVDGCDQNRMKNYEWKECDIKKHSGIIYATNNDYDFAEGEYNEGYGENSEKSVTHRRSIYFVKKDVFRNKPFFIVVDRLYPMDEDQHQYEVLWHLEDEYVKISGLDILTENLCIFVSGSNSMIVKLKKGEKEPEWQGWKVCGLRQGDYKEGNAVSCKVSGRELRVVTVLYPYASECPIEGIRASENNEDRNIEFIISRNETYLFDENLQQFHKRYKNSL